MVTIRLSRGGVRKKPFYHIVVADHRRARDGKHIERIGFYNPFAGTTETAVEYDNERYNYWLSVGAKPSERVKKIVSKLSD